MKSMKEKTRRMREWQTENNENDKKKGTKRTGQRIDEANVVYFIDLGEQ